MILDYLKYKRRNEKANEWAVEGKDGNLVKFENINLIVGKNSAGKTRLLEVIRTIANLLSLKEPVRGVKYSQVRYDIILKENEDRYVYSLEIKNAVIAEESLSVNGVEKYNRSKKTIYSEKAQQFVEISLDGELPITSLKDNGDYPYIAEIFEWSNALRKYSFTNQYEKEHLLNKEAKSVSGSESIVQLFTKGEQHFGESFVQSVITDFKHIGYEVSGINLYRGDLGTGIAVQEEELTIPTTQEEMSQGMFRALSFIIRLNFALLRKKSVCLLIDDLGEGLDFSRSKSLIDLLIYKIDGSDIQTFITTNDPYVMNKIPLKYWSVVERRAKSSLFYNYHNSKETFDDFKYTGLSNFDFLATDFYHKGFEDEPEV